MSYGPELLLVGAVAAVGVLHTMVPDHWLPIALIARQRGWSKAETAWAALQAGTGHVLSTLLIALVVWVAGVAVAHQFGHVVDTASSIALIAFGGWIAISGWRELHSTSGHGHSHSHDFPHLGARGQDHIHGPELRRIATEDGVMELLIFETGAPPRFRIPAAGEDSITVETFRHNGAPQTFLFASHGTYWESLDEIPEPHQFAVMVTVSRAGRFSTYAAEFTEHDHLHGTLSQTHNDTHRGELELELADDPLYAPTRGETALLTRHNHIHRHGRGFPHLHWHDHAANTAHEIVAETDAKPPAHEHRHKTTARTALLLILGSSPMVEGIPAFFAAGQYGIGLILLMSVVFGASTIATYVVFCVYSTAGLQRMRFGAFERYGEVLSGAFIALVGVAFWVWPVV
jgi:hypothetical protein